MQISTLLRRTVASVGLAVIALMPGFAQSAFPSKQVSIIVPFSPGGGADLLGRLLAKKFQDASGQTVIVLNKPGAAGMIGARKSAALRPTGTRSSWRRAERSCRRTRPSSPPSRS